MSSQNDSVTTSVSNIQVPDFHGGQDPSFLRSHPFNNQKQLILYPGHTMNVFPYQPVSYAMPTQANNLLTGLGPISHTGYSMPPSQHYFVPMPSFQQSIGGQPYPGQQVNTSPHHLSRNGVADQSDGAVRLVSIPRRWPSQFFQDKERTGQSLKQSRSSWQRGPTRTRQPWLTN